MSLCWYGAWIHCWFLGSLWLFNVKPFLETCIFPIDDQPEGLVVCDNSSAYYKIAEDVSQLEAITILLKKVWEFLLDWLYVSNYFLWIDFNFAN